MTAASDAIGLAPIGWWTETSVRLLPHRRLAVRGGRRINPIRVFAGLQYLVLFPAARLSLHPSAKNDTPRSGGVPPPWASRLAGEVRGAFPYPVEF
jgi:hypothetical protein